MMRKSVVLPEPDGPSSASNVPWGTSRLMLSRDLKLQKDFDTVFMRIVMIVPLNSSLCECLPSHAPFARDWPLQLKSRLPAASAPMRPQKILAGCILETVFLSSTASCLSGRQYGRKPHRQRRTHR